MLKGVGPAAALGRDTVMLREILDKTVGRIAEDLKGQPNVEAELRNTIGTVYWQLGEFDKAAEMHRQALAMQRKLIGNESPSVATSLHHLAEALRQQIKLAESEAAFRESLAIRRKFLGNEHSDVAQTLNDLGSLLSIKLKDDEPEVLLREALAIRRKLYGNEHRDVATSLYNVAHVLNRHGQVDEAVAMHEEALAIRRKVLGDAHPDLIYSFRNLAGALDRSGKSAPRSRRTERSGDARAQAGHFIPNAGGFTARGRKIFSAAGHAG
jgi:tetratricopeptide (TPR) repeat protein